MSSGTNRVGQDATTSINGPALDAGGVHQAVGQLKAVQAEQFAALVALKLLLAVGFDAIVVGLLDASSRLG